MTDIEQRVAKAIPRAGMLGWTPGEYASMAQRLLAALAADGLVIVPTALVEADMLDVIRDCVWTAGQDPLEPERFRERCRDAVSRIDAYLEATR